MRFRDSLRVIILVFVFISFFLQDNYAFELSSRDVEITLSESFVSGYIWRGQDLYADNDPAYQPSINIVLPGFLEGADISFNVWGSFPVNSGHENIEELDYTLSLSRDISEDCNLSFGCTYFDFPNAASASDVNEPWAYFTLNKIPGLGPNVAMNIFAAYDFQARSGGPDEGWYYSYGFSTDIPLPKTDLTQTGQAISLGIANWGNDGVADLKPSFLYASELSLATTYKFSGFSITPGLHYAINHSGRINNGKDEFWGVLGLSYTF